MNCFSYFTIKMSISSIFFIHLSNSYENKNVTGIRRTMCTGLPVPDVSQLQPLRGKKVNVPRLNEFGAKNRRITDASLSYTFQGEGERGRELLTDAKEKSRGVLRADGYFRANFRSQAKVVPEDQEPVDGGFSERRERETSRETAQSSTVSRHVYAQIDRIFSYVRRRVSQIIGSQRLNRLNQVLRASSIDSFSLNYVIKKTYFFPSPTYWTRERER